MMDSNRTRKKRKGYVGILAFGLSAVAVLFCGWLVYAQEIAKDVDAVAQAAAGPINPVTGKPAYALDEKAVQLEKQVRTRVEQNMVEGINANLYDLGPLSLNGAPRTEAILTNHFSWFCATSPAGPEEGGDCPKDDPLLQYGDVKVSSILSGTAYDANRQRAVNQFLFNLIPIPENNFKPFLKDNRITVASLPSSLDPKDPRSKQFPNPQQQFVQALTEQAILSVVREPYAEMIAKRTVPAEGEESVMQMMERNAVQRFMSSSWRKMLMELKPEQIMQEQAAMQAYQIWLEYQRYRQMERVEALLATMILQNYSQGKAVAAQFASVPSTAR